MILIFCSFVFCPLDQMFVHFSKSWGPRNTLVPVVTGTISPFVGERRKSVVFMFTELFLFFKKKKGKYLSLVFVLYKVMFYNLNL